MRTRVVELAELGQAELEEWEILADRAIEPNPFMDPRWLSPNGQPHADAANTRLLIVDDAGEFLAMMPLEVVDRRIQGLPVRMVMSATSFQFPMTPHYFPLVDRSRPVEAIEELLRGLRRHGLPGFLDLASVPKSTELTAAFAAAAESARTPLVDRGELEFAYCYRGIDDTMPPVESGARQSPELQPARLRSSHLSTSTAKKYRHRLHALERHTGGELTMTDRGNDPDAIEEFLDFQARGWKGQPDRGGGALRIVGRDRWFAQVAAAFREHNQLSIFSMGSQLGTVYMAVAFRSGDGVFGSQDAYEEDFAQFSAGALGRLATLDYTFSNSSANFFDPNMRPKYVQSSQLYPDRRLYSTFLIATHGALPSAVVRSIPVLRRMRDRMMR